MVVYMQEEYRRTFLFANLAKQRYIENNALCIYPLFKNTSRRKS
jgi:hypothetical protein